VAFLHSQSSRGSRVCRTSCRIIFRQVFQAQINPRLWALSQHL
jgi:hypothetical protein